MIKLHSCCLHGLSCSQVAVLPKRLLRVSCLHFRIHHCKPTFWHLPSVNRQQRQKHSLMPDSASLLCLAATNNMLNLDSMLMQVSRQRLYLVCSHPRHLNHYSCHAAKVFHRDLKPKNILANSDCKLKVCDFGLARPSFNDMPTTIFWTDYVATRWYRAPELCGSFFAKYSPAIDIWSIGCIFAEILLGKPLFPGRNVVHQLELITDLLGTPSPQVVAKVIRHELVYLVCVLSSACYQVL